MYLAGLDEILEMQDEISTQLDIIERNASDAHAILKQLNAGAFDDEDTDTAELEQKLLAKLDKLKANFDKQAKAITDISKGSIKRFRKLIEGDDSKDEPLTTVATTGGGGGGGGDESGQQWVVKWHNNGVSTSPRFHSEAQAYRYFVNVGDFAKKLLGYDGQRWAVIKTYGGRQWLTLMTDDGSYQSSA